MGKHTYKNDRIEVSWDSDVCIHAAECVKSLEKVFDPKKKPWINVDAASNSEIINAIKKCPSGALQFSSVGEESRKQIKPVTIVVAQNSALRVSGNVRLEDSEGNQIESPERFALCRCGASENKPFCDGSHKRIGFVG